LKSILASLIWMVASFTILISAKSSFFFHSVYFLIDCFTNYDFVFVALAVLL
jgi:hypothetical protein